MQDSQMKTLNVPTLSATDSGTTPAANPALVYQATKIPLRVVVRNISSLGRNVLLSYAKNAISNGELNPQASFTLPPGASETFALLPGETLYAATVGLDPALISIAVSVAFPFEVHPA